MALSTTLESSIQSKQNFDQKHINRVITKDLQSVWNYLQSRIYTSEETDETVDLTRKDYTQSFLLMGS